MTATLAPARRRESKVEKASRLLATGKVWVEHVEPGHVVGLVEGDHGRWTVSLEAGYWTCGCPHPRQFCSHALALRSITHRRPDS